MSSFFVIHNSDGDTIVERLSGEELKKRLNENWYGQVEFLEEIVESDTNYWKEGTLLIIKGDIAVPTNIVVVKEYGLD